MADNIFGTLAALMSLNDDVTAPTTPFGAPPMAGTGGATNSYQQYQEQAPQEELVPQIYTGKEQETVITGGHPTRPSTKTVKVDGTEKVDDAMQAFAKAPLKEQRRMALLLSLAGYAGSGSFESLVAGAYDMTLGDTLDAYNELLMEAATRYVLHQNKVTPEQILTRAIAYKMPTSANWNGNLDDIGSALSNLGIKIDGVDAEEALSGTEEVGADGEARKDKPFTGVKTSTSTSTVRDVMDPNDAKALTRAMLQRELGRDPTEEEFADFIGAVQYAQKVNPSVSTTKQSYRYKKDELVSQTSNTTTREGIGSEGLADIALQRARQNPNWAEWQAVGTYAPALFEALGATVQGR